jgi:hypothetical protein
MFLQIIHSTVVDTAIVFPHRLGLPYKRALKTLMAEYVRKIIQDSGKSLIILLYIRGMGRLCSYKYRQCIECNINARFGIRGRLYQGV